MMKLKQIRDDLFCIMDKMPEKTWNERSNLFKHRKLNNGSIRTDYLNRANAWQYIMDKVVAEAKEKTNPRINEQCFDQKKEASEYVEGLYNKEYKENKGMEISFISLDMRRGYS